MRRFKYIGDCAKGFVTLGLLTFKKDEAVKVDDERLCGKLEGNTKFKEVKSRGAKNGNESGTTGQGSEKAGKEGDRASAPESVSE